MEKFDINAAPFEIERKFLIEYPDLDAVRAMPDYSVIHISQTYLAPAEDFIGGRIRRIADNGKISYIYTYKKRLSDLTRREYERELSEAEYLDLLKRRQEGTATIEKDRHIFSWSGLRYELDIYTFWSDKATLEAEVESEDVEIKIPPCVKLIRDVTLDRRYNNSRLARSLGVIED